MNSVQQFEAKVTRYQGSYKVLEYFLLHSSKGDRTQAAVHESRHSSVEESADPALEQLRCSNIQLS
jgi:hypothetical protein